MMKDILHERLTGLEPFKALTQHPGRRTFRALGVCDALKPLLLRALTDGLDTPVLFVAQNDWAAHAAAMNVPGALFIPSRDVILRPAALSRERTFERVRALSRIGGAAVVCLSVGALRQRVCPPDLFVGATVELRVNDEVPPAQALKRLIHAGYERVPNCEDMGQAALRGDILDVYSPDGAFRAEFFGDVVESISAFDPATQRSAKDRREGVRLLPAHEFVFDYQSKKRAISFVEAELRRTRDRSGYELIAGKLTEYAQQLNDGLPFDDMRNFLHAVYEGGSILGYLPPRAVVLDSYSGLLAALRTAAAELHESIVSALSSGYALTGMETLDHPATAVFEELLSGYLVDLCPYDASTSLKVDETVDFGSRALHAAGRVPDLMGEIKRRVEAGYDVALLTGAASRAATMSRSLSENGITSRVHVLDAPLTAGFELPAASLMVYGERDIYGSKGTRKKTRRRTLLFDELKAGDIIVHDAHGKGKYLGLKTETAAGVVRDYMVLEYRDGDKLYLPIDQIDRIQKYVSGSDAPPKLNKLGGKEWEHSKAKARASLAELAQDLFALYSKRANARGYMFSPDTVWQAEFESAFPYAETDGQLSAIADIKADMESGRVMDRLLLGDVGYGKTEVAMRACFKAVMDGKQCAVLAPTTLLANQHYETFTERFAGFPANIACLSRFVPPAEQKKALIGLKEGSVDIVVGTHRLLSKDVEFHDLGLLIVDEEHKFGVAHKERIKELKTNIDVLSMSATPIPRTLEMSLTGIRDMSAIETPIEERLPVSTFVLEYSVGMVREAVMREKARGGQTFFVCRRISTLGQIAAQMAKHVPEASCRIAHGQMGREQLEGIMEDFVAGAFDVLLCTTIVESGLDIRSANTIIVYEADHFGISELYQLKGRVGRGDVPAYAYLTFLSELAVSPDAQKRLSALRDFTEFGSGMKIAMRDLEIRGAGNLLGAEQSGHMANVGYEMYLRLMKEALSELKGEPAKPDRTAVIELDVDAHIDSAYIEDEDARIEAYKRISRITTPAQASEMMSELTERYSTPPAAVKNLITVALMRSLCRSRGVASVIKKTDVIEIKFHRDARADPQSLLNAIEGVWGARLRPGEPAAIVVKNKKCTIVELFEMISKINCK